MKQPGSTEVAESGRTEGTEGACWAFAVRRVRDLVGIELPADWAGVLAAPAAIADEVGTCWALQVGDLVLMRGWFSPRDHVGVAIDAFTIEHLDSDGRAAAVPIAAVRRSGLLKRVMRPRRPA